MKTLDYTNLNEANVANVVSSEKEVMELISAKKFCWKLLQDGASSEALFALEDEGYFGNLDVEAVIEEYRSSIGDTEISAEYSALKAQYIAEFGDKLTNSHEEMWSWELFWYLLVEGVSLQALYELDIKGYFGNLECNNVIREFLYDKYGLDDPKYNEDLISSKMYCIKLLNRGINTDFILFLFEDGYFWNLDVPAVIEEYQQELL